MPPAGFGAGATAKASAVKSKPAKPAKPNASDEEEEEGDVAEDEFEVDGILEERKGRRGEPSTFRVRWKGWPMPGFEDTFEPEDNLPKVTLTPGPNQTQTLTQHWPYPEHQP